MATSLFGQGNAVNVNVSGTLVPQSFTGTAGQTLFSLTNFTYTPGTNSLLVFINGQRQIVGRDFIETSAGSFTLVEGLIAGDYVDVIGFPQINLTSVIPGSISIGNNYTFGQSLLDNFINVRAAPYNAPNDGITDATAAIQAADTAAFAIGATLLFPAGYYVFTGTAIKSPCYFLGGQLVVNTVTLTFSKEVTAARNQVFLGSGDLVLNNATIYPEWFGVFNSAAGNDGSVNNETQSKRMMRCVQNSQSELNFGFGTYYLRDLLVDGSNVTISGQGRGTILKPAKYWNASTRIGVFVSAFSPNIDAGVTLTAGNSTWTATSQQKNIIFRDFDIEWDTTGFTPDLTMNGIAVMGYDKVLIERVHVKLNGANRAFYVGCDAKNQKTYNVEIRNCKSFSCVTGAFVLEGITGGATGTELKGVNIHDNEFNVLTLSSISSQGSSSGLYLSGTPPATVLTEKVLFIRNRVNGGTCGVLTSGPSSGTIRLQSELIIEDNYFNAFLEQGIQVYTKKCSIRKNTFDSTILVQNSLQIGGIVFYTASGLGTFEADVESNIFKNLSVASAGFPRGIHINCVSGMLLNIAFNRFLYENAVAPQYDIFYLDSTGIPGDVNLLGNKFYNTGAANVRGTTLNDAFYFMDAGNNVNLNLYNELTKYNRSVAPSETTRRFVRGEAVRYYQAGAGAGSQIGWVCTATGAPGTWRTIIG